MEPSRSFWPATPGVAEYVRGDNIEQVEHIIVRTRLQRGARKREGWRDFAVRRSLHPTGPLSPW
jgi:hypothetical protein